MGRTGWRAVVVAAVVVWAAGVACGKTIYVDDDANSPGDGRTWATAYRYLQDALADANSSPKPVEVRVAQGVYRPDQGDGRTAGAVSASFVLRSGLKLMGGHAGIGAADPNARDPRLYTTILSGDLADNDVDVNDPWNALDEPTRVDNSLNVVVCDHADGTAVIDGFTVRSGHLNARGGHGGTAGGAGMVNYESNPTIRDCIFRGNVVAGTGGGIFNLSSSPSIINCVFEENLGGYGAAVGASNGSPALTDCTFIDNRARINGGAVHMAGGNPTILRGRFARNSATESGGAVLLGGGLSELRNCLFMENAADWGGAVSLSHDAGILFENCTFSSNTASHGNSLATNSYGGLSPSSVEIENCILWGDDEGGPGGSGRAKTVDGASYFKEVWNEDRSRIAIRYSNLRGGCDAIHDGYGDVIWGDGNTDADPLFADPTQGDVHLKSQAGRWLRDDGRWTTDDVTSPCIDAGDPMSPIGWEPFPNGGRVNMGAYGGTVEASKSYFGGPVCDVIVAGDINGDCRVDFADFAILARQWLGEGEWVPVCQDEPAPPIE